MKPQILETGWLENFWNLCPDRLSKLGWTRLRVTLSTRAHF